MKTSWLMIAIAAIALGLWGCNKAENPAEVSHDVAEAQQDAAEEVAEETQEATRDNVVSQDDSAEIRIAKAEGDHKVAIEQCEALSGDAQKACKDQADATLEQAKADAHAMTQP